MEFRSVKKILIFKLCCFGDTVFITPAIASLKKAFPDAEIYYAYDKWVEPMMKNIPYINGSILFEDVYNENLFSKAKGTIKFIQAIRKQKFDMVLNGHRSGKLSFILSLCNIKYRLGFNGTKYLTHTAEFRADLKEYMRYQFVLSENGIPVIPCAPHLKKNISADINMKLGILPEDKVIGIYPAGGSNPGTQMNIKKWSLVKFYEVIEILNKKYPDYKILLFEGKLPHEKLEIPLHLKTIKTEINNDVLARCDIYLSADTGSLHIAAAFGASTVSVFGPSDPGLLAPVNNKNSNTRHMVVSRGLICSPCYTPATSIDKKNSKYWRGNNFICHLGTNECMSSVSAQNVFTALEDVIRFIKNSKAYSFSAKNNINEISNN